MTDLRQAAQQALHALVLCRDWVGAYDECSQAVKALEAALAAPQPEPKPVGFMWRHIQTGCTTVLLPNFYSDTGGSWLCVGPLYTHPPQRQPLTEEQITEILGGYPADVRHQLVLLVRAVEAMHEIGGDK